MYGTRAVHGTSIDKFQSGRGDQKNRSIPFNNAVTSAQLTRAQAREAAYYISAGYQERERESRPRWGRADSAHNAVLRQIRSRWIIRRAVKRNVQNHRRDPILLNAPAILFPTRFRPAEIISIHRNRRPRSDSPAVILTLYELFSER